MLFIIGWLDAGIDGLQKRRKKQAVPRDTFLAWWAQHGFPNQKKKKAALEREEERKKEMLPFTTSAESNAESGEGRLRSRSS